MVKKIGFIALSLFFIQSTIVEANSRFTFDPRRESPAAYDPGPAHGSAWSVLYGSAPNYRLIGREILDGRGEKFRWKWGPMWYRGRLAPQSVKVFVVGQEGAQDENVSNRAFTGSTGTKTQKLLNYMGIYESYLFMNTFVYTINGQLDGDPKFKWLEQGRSFSETPDRLLRDGKVANCYPGFGLSQNDLSKYKVTCGSPLVDYRHLLFDNMARTNNQVLNIVLGVGSGGKASVATWINHVVGQDICSPERNLAGCNTKEVREQIHSAFNAKFGTRYSNSNPLVVLGVPHPGGASPRNGGSGALRNIVNGFEQAANIVSIEMSRNSNFLPKDRQEPRSRKRITHDLTGDYSYGNAPIPFKDFAFGTNWRMGDRGTTSNRRGSHAIQVFSYQGKYNNDGHSIQTSKYIQDDVSGIVTESIGGTPQGRVPGMHEMDLAYEPPRFVPNEPYHVNQYDYGPCRVADIARCPLADMLQMGWPAFDQVDGKEELISDPSFGHGPIYRGDLIGSEVLVFADQMSFDDFFSTRALTGLAGQRLQTALYLAGVEGNYGILRTLPVDTLQKRGNQWGVSPKLVEASQAKLVELLAVVSERKKVVVVIGDQAKAAFKRFSDSYSNYENKLIIELDPPSSTNVDAYKDMIRKVSKTITGRTTRLANRYVGANGPIARAIPRADLPYSTRWWMGTSGSRVVRPVCTNCGPGTTIRNSSDAEGDYYTAHAPKWVNDLKNSPRKTREDLIEIDRIRHAVGASGRSAAESSERALVQIENDRLFSEGAENCYLDLDENPKCISDRSSQFGWVIDDSSLPWVNAIEEIFATPKLVVEAETGTVLEDYEYEEVSIELPYNN